MTATIKMIAERAGVSIATVSLALNGDRRVAKKTRERIRGLAGELDFVPSNLGRALQSRRSCLAGYLVSKVNASFFSEILQGMGEAAVAGRYGLLVAITSGSSESELEQLRLFREKRVDGVLVSNAHDETKKALVKMDGAGTPVVVCSSESFNRRIPCVLVNNRKGGALAAEHLIKLGHRRLAYCFAGDKCLRYCGAVSAARRGGVAPPLCLDTEEALKRKLMSKQRPTGIIAFSDFDAVRVKHIAESAGLVVPGDLSVVGFDDIALAALPEFSFTTVAQPKSDIGRVSMELLLARIGGEGVRSKLLEPELVVRGSSAEPGQLR